MATADLLVDQKLSPELVTLALLHHINPDSVPDLARLTPASDDNWVEALAVISKAPLLDISGGDIYPYGPIDVTRSLQRNINLVPLLLGSSIDSLERSQRSQRVIGNDLLLLTRNDNSLRNYAENTFDYLVPFAHFLHLDKLVWRLEDSCYAIQEPDRYGKIQGEFGGHVAERTALLEELKTVIAESLGVATIEGVVDGRSKSIFSIARKLNQSSHSIELWDIRDLLALRVVIPDPSPNTTQTIVQDCHRVIEAVSRKLPLAQGTYRDYVNHPLPTGYQAIHFGVEVTPEIQSRYSVSARLKSIEIQVRTQELHKRAEYGEWSHFLYKMEQPAANGQRISSDPVTLAKQEWNRKWKHFFTKNIPIRDERGHVRLIERGATLCDAAYMLLDSGLELARVDVDRGEGIWEHIPFDDERFYESLPPWCKVVPVPGHPGQVTPSPARLGEVSYRGARLGLSRFIAPTCDRETLVHQGERILSDAQELSRSWSFSMAESSAATSRALEDMAAFLGLSSVARNDFFEGLARGAFSKGDYEIAMRLRELFYEAGNEAYSDEAEVRRRAWDRRLPDLP